MPTPTEKANNAQKSLKRQRERMRAVERAALRKAGGVLAASAWGLLNRLGVPTSIGPVPVKLPVWGLAQVIEVAAGGGVGSFFGGVADSTLAVYTERAISTDSLIAGEGDGDPLMLGEGDDEVDALLREAASEAIDV